MVQNQDTGISKITYALERQTCFSTSANKLCGLWSDTKKIEGDQIKIVLKYLLWIHNKFDEMHTLDHCPKQNLIKSETILDHFPILRHCSNYPSL